MPLDIPQSKSSLSPQTSGSRTIRPGLKTSLKNPSSAWRDDDNNEDTTPTNNKTNKTHSLPTQPSQISNTPTITPPIRLTITLDQGHNKVHSNIYSVPELQKFHQLQHTIATLPTWQHLPTTKPVSVHIDKFTITLTNAQNERISSDLRSTEKKYRTTGTRYSSETYDALMGGAVITRCHVSSMHGVVYCLCGRCQGEDVVECPEIRVHLATLDLSNERVYRALGSRKVDPRKVVVVDYPAFGLLSSVREGGDGGFGILVAAACVRGLLGRGRSGVLALDVAEQQGGLCEWVDEEEEEDDNDRDAGRKGGNEAELRKESGPLHTADCDSDDADIQHHPPVALAFTRGESEVIEISDDNEGYDDNEDEDDLDGDVLMAGSGTLKRLTSNVEQSGRTLWSVKRMKSSGIWKGRT